MIKNNKYFVYLLMLIIILFLLFLLLIGYNRYLENKYNIKNIKYLEEYFNKDVEKIIEKEYKINDKKYISKIKSGQINVLRNKKDIKNNENIKDTVLKNILLSKKNNEIGEIRNIVYFNFIKTDSLEINIPYDNIVKNKIMINNINENIKFDVLDVYVRSINDSNYIVLKLNVLIKDTIYNIIYKDNKSELITGKDVKIENFVNINNENDLFNNKEYINKKIYYNIGGFVLNDFNKVNLYLFGGIEYNLLKYKKLNINLSGEIYYNLNNNLDYKNKFLFGNKVNIRF